MNLSFSTRTFFKVVLLGFLGVFSRCNQIKNPASIPTHYVEDDFAKVQKFDVHTHFNMYDTTFLQQAEADNFRVLTINVSPDYYPPIEKQLEISAQLVKERPGHISFATTFSTKNFSDANWLTSTIDYLKKSISQGAIAVKVWKNIGMELKDNKGKFVMIDDTRFDTVFSFLAENNITLIGHLGEPRNCWLPIEQMTVAGDKRYFTKHPEYHMFLHPEYPSYEDQVNARDHMLEKHPDLKFVGAHLGSLEWSVDELAKRLDKFPHMAVDMAGRISHFQYQAAGDWQKVYDFFIRYQDRILYATDLEVDTSKTPAVRNKQSHEKWLRDWKFLTGSENLEVPDVEKSFKALNLPAGVVDKIYRLNAEKWFALLPKTSQGNTR